MRSYDIGPTDWKLRVRQSIPLRPDVGKFINMLPAAGIFSSIGLSIIRDAIDLTY